MITLTLTDQEAEEFKNFRKHQSWYDQYHQNWKQVIGYADTLKHGAFTITIRDGLPVKINRPMQQVIIGVKI